MNVERPERAQKGHGTKQQTRQLRRRSGERSEFSCRREVVTHFNRLNVQVVPLRLDFCSLLLTLLIEVRHSRMFLAGIVRP